MKSYTIIEILDILIADQLGVTRAFLNSIENRFSDYDRSAIYGVITEDGLPPEQARAELYKKLSEKEINCVKMMNSDNNKIVTITN